jgi:DNA-binding CsgD family transcriptional regulator
MIDPWVPMPRSQDHGPDQQAVVAGALRPGSADREYGSVRADLSQRELEIIELVATGLTNQEIALKLMISKRTVDNHVSNIFTKTGARNRVALLNWALDNGKICRDGFNCCAITTDPQA